MQRNYYVLNVSLAMIIAFLGVRLYKVLTTRLELPAEPSAVRSRNSNQKGGQKIARGAGSSFDVIVSKNLFHPSRSTITNKAPEVSKPVSRSEIPQLFGTIIMNDRKLAILEDRAAKKSNLYEVNDSVSGFLVAKIMENKVVLQRGGEKIEVNLREDKQFSRTKQTERRRRAVREARKRRRPRRIRRSRTQRRRPPVTRRKR
jgi:hypothetical protein